jgi:RND family efflux transporter MFP subunit
MRSPLVVLLLTGSLGFATAWAQSPLPANVDLAPAVRADFAPLHWTPASIVSREDARIAAEIGGRVVSVAEVGSRLRRGEPLAQLDDAALRLGERQAQAELARLQAQLDYARRQEERYQALLAKAGISGAQLDQASAERRMREQDVAMAQVALEQARLQRRRATVRAPFDGIVVERAIEAGEFLALGAPVARLVNPLALEVRARAPVALAGHLEEGTAVTLRIGEASQALQLSTMVPVGDEASRQLELRVGLDAETSEAEGLVVGAAVRLGVPSDAPRQVVAVPRDALILRKEGNYVVRVGDDRAAERVPVDTGAAQGELVEVVGAIRAGDWLVVRGGERLQPGQRVSVAAPDASESALTVARDPG